MSTEQTNNKRIAKNTLLLYGRMFLTVGISFYTTRLILLNLGIGDYGVYNVIGGFVSMFYMVTSTMTQAVSRFLTFELGAEDKEKLRSTFSTAINILLLFSFIVLLLAETVGLWFVNTKLNIDADRMMAANWVYQFSVISFIVEMISVPYSASVISHEKMGTFALVTIVKCVLNLCIALLLTYSPIDRLVFYSLLVLLTSLSIQLMYWIYCSRNFAECNYTMHIDRNIFKDLFNFAGWNFFTTVSAMLSTVGLDILINIFFGTTLNAAKGVSSQLKGTAGAFYKNFAMAINPQITKSYAANNTQYTSYLICTSAKFTYLLFLLCAMPLMFEAEFFLSVWLKDPPEYSVEFIRLLFISVLIETLQDSSEIANKATGHIRNYQLLVSFTQIMIFPLSYVVLKLGGSPYSIYSVSIAASLVMFYPRIRINEKYVGLSFATFLKKVVFPIMAVTAFSAILCYLIYTNIPMSWWRLISTGCVSTLSISILTIFIALNVDERNKLLSVCEKKFFRK